MFARSAFPGWRTAMPLGLLALLVLALSVVQYRWLGELAEASRERLGRDLRVATLTMATTVDLEVSRLAAQVEATGGDSVAMAHALVQWEADHASLAGLVGAVGQRQAGGWRWHQRPGGGPLLASPDRIDSLRVALRLDSLFVADSLLLRLASRIGASAELTITASLAQRSASGAETVLGSTGAVPDAPPDVVTGLLATPGEVRMVFLASRQPPELDASPPGVSWVAESADAAPAERPGAGLELRVWHGAGSLERAVAATRRRNLLIGFGLMALLTAVGTSTLGAFRRNQRLAEDRATVLAGISHEIGTPLAVIRSAADNLRHGVVGGDARVAEYGALIDDQAARLAGTVATAVAFARTADPARHPRDRVDLVAIARGAAEGADPRVRLEATGEAWCHGDAHALAMAVRNLVANACDYSPADAAVTISVSQGPRRVALSVADRGPGVPAGEVARIFEPFARGAAGIGSRKGGLGLGLALAMRVATLHGGDLTCVSRPGGGAIFTLALPAVP